MRNVGGQVVGVSSKSVFGQPGRVTGIVVGEWEERSPWAPLAERRGAWRVDAVTVHGCTGTIDVADIVADNGVDLLEIDRQVARVRGHERVHRRPPRRRDHGVHRAAVGRPASPRAYPDIDDVQQRLYEATRRCPVERAGPRPTGVRRRRTAGSTSTGVVHLVEDPDHMLVLVNGGLGNLHALALHSFGPTRAVTRAF